MKTQLHAITLLLGLLPVSSLFADGLQEASIKEAVNTVSYQANDSTPQKPAKTGTLIHPDNIVRTGIQSRAELEFNDHTVTRMGASSVFTFDAKAQKLNLEQGTMLFCKPKQDSTFEISTPSATCAISGTTGFMEVLPGKNGDKSSFFFGLIEGKTKITIGGVTYPLQGGKLLIFMPNGSVRVVDFDVAAFVRKAGLIVKFKSTLPNQAEIDAAVAQYLALVDRGFITSFDNKPQHRRFDSSEDFGFLDFAAQVDLFEQKKQAGVPQPPTPPDHCCRPPCGNNNDE